jgi:hypothetical protein
MSEGIKSIRNSASEHKLYLDLVRIACYAFGDDVF